MLRIIVINILAFKIPHNVPEYADLTTPMLCVKFADC